MTGERWLVRIAWAFSWMFEIGSGLCRSVLECPALPMFAENAFIQG